MPRVICLHGTARHVHLSHDELTSIAAIIEVPFRYKVSRYRNTWGGVVCVFFCLGGLSFRLRVFHFFSLVCSLHHFHAWSSFSPTSIPLILMASLTVDGGAGGERKTDGERKRIQERERTCGKGKGRGSRKTETTAKIGISGEICLWVRE